MELTPEEIRARRLRKLETGSSGGGGGGGSRLLAPVAAPDGQQKQPDQQQQDTPMVDGETGVVVASSTQAGKPQRKEVNDARGSQLAVEKIKITHFCGCIVMHQS